MYINMTSAFIILIGGLAIVFIYPGRISDGVRLIIGVLVAFYFLARMGQVILVMRRERMKREKGLKYLVEDTEADNDRPKRP